jgi:hypothetical protein
VSASRPRRGLARGAASLTALFTLAAQAQSPGAPAASASPPAGASMPPLPSAPAAQRAPQPSASASAPPKAPPPAPTNAPLESPRRFVALPAPFGPGTPVLVTSSKQLVTVYVAREPAEGQAPSVYDFVKTGRTPLTIQLPPGSYYLDAEADGVTRGGLLLRVGTHRRYVQIHTGSSSMSGLSTLTLAVGAACVLAATVILVSVSSGPSALKKSKFTIPLYASGGALLAGGVALYFASRTNIDDVTSENPALRPASTGRPSALLGGVRLGF